VPYLESILAEGIKPVEEGQGNWGFYPNPLLTFRPDNAVVWLTENKKAPEFCSHLLLGEVNEGILMRVTVELSLNCRWLHCWRPWLRKHDPLLCAMLDNDVEMDEEEGWREHWFYDGVITPDKIVCIDFDPEISAGAQHLAMMEWTED
jgi:hypothetical protein